MPKDEKKEERKRRKAEKKERKKKKKSHRIDGGDVEDGRNSKREKSLENGDKPSDVTSAEMVNGEKNGVAASISESAPIAAPSVRTGPIGSESDANNEIYTVEGSPFRRVKVRTIVSLAPSSLSDVQGNLRRLSCESVTRYAGGLGGVLLAIEDLRSIDDGSGRGMGAAGRVMNELPHIHFNVEAVAVVFKPQVGTRLTGKVNESFPSHVGILVNGFINASVSADQMRRAGYFFDGESYEWKVERDIGEPEVVDVGDRISFSLQKVHECNGIVSLEGSDPSIASGGRDLT